MIGDRKQYFVRSDVIVYGRCLSPYPTPEHLDDGQRLQFDPETDLALLLSGRLSVRRSTGTLTIWSGPTVVLKSDMLGARVFAMGDVEILRMTSETCRRHLVRDIAFRGLFFDAMSARLRALASARRSMAVVH